MGRQRMVRPELFVHDDLFDAEKASGLPLRLAYIGLWTQADREGRFEWRPRRLKAVILPWDNVDFGAILEALAEHGFIVKYTTSDGKAIGAIPSWQRHQRPHTNEKASEWPAPPSNGAPTCTNGASACDNGAPTCTNGAPTSPKSKSKSKTETETETETESEYADCDWSNSNTNTDFDTFWETYPRRIEKQKALKAWMARCKDGIAASDMIRAAQHYAAACIAKKTETQFIKHPSTFIGPDRPYEDWINPQPEEIKNGAKKRGNRAGQRYSADTDEYTRGGNGETQIDVPGHAAPDEAAGGREPGEGGQG